MTSDKKYVFQVVRNVKEKDLQLYTFSDEEWKHILQSPYLVSNKGRIYNPKEETIYIGLTLDEYFEIQELED